MGSEGKKAFCLKGPISSRDLLLDTPKVGVGKANLGTNRVQVQKTWEYNLLHCLSIFPILLRTLSMALLVELLPRYFGRFRLGGLLLGSGITKMWEGAVRKYNCLKTNIQGIYNSLIASLQGKIPPYRMVQVAKWADKTYIKVDLHPVL